MKTKTIPDLQQAGTSKRSAEFARLVLELAALSPQRLRDLGDEMLDGEARRSEIPNER